VSVTAAAGRRHTSAQPFVVFLHIPKTGGKTVAAVLHHHYGDEFRGGIGVDAETPPTRQIPNVFSRAAYVETRCRQLGANPSVRAVAAHITFGLHELFPPDARWLTVLRDPVERTLAQYAFLLPHDGQRTRGLGVVPPWLPPPPPELTLEQCLEAGGYIPDNLQTRLLCGLASPFDPLPPDALDRAIRNLRERFAFVGTTERLPEFLAVLNVGFGWPTVAYRPAKSAPAARGHELSGDLLALVEEHNRLDRDLYACAAGLLDRAIAGGGPELRLEIEVLRRAEQVRKARRREEPADGRTALRSLPVSARVELALKEAELALTRVQVKRLRSRIRWRLLRPQARRPEPRRVPADRA
jgi:hypothetical protein